VGQWSTKAGVVWWMLLAAGSCAVVIAVMSSACGPSDLRLVQDSAGLLTVGQQNAVARYHQHLLDDFDIDYRVVTARGLDDINEAAVALFREVGQTSRSRSGRALLLLIDPAANRVRLEVGYPLEGTFPDAFVDHVERQQMVPFFELDRIADGIVATTELIVTRAQRSADGMGAAAEAWSAASGGAGAATAARLGAGPRETASSPARAVEPGRSPEETLLAYFRAMAAHNSSPGLGIYTPETREMLKGWLMTPAQMDNLVRTYRGCQPEAPIFDPKRSRAVIRYPDSQRSCAPFFFQRVDADWLLDLTMMQRAIRFDAANAWHFVPHADHPYRYAFED
jgi:uncharacterized protein